MSRSEPAPGDPLGFPRYAKRLMVGLALIALSGCAHETKPPAVSKEAPAPVRVIRVERKSWPDSYEATGTVRARTSAVIASKVMAYIREMKVEAGDRVAAGQLLVVLDSRDLDAGVKSAEAARFEAASGAAEADDAIVSAKANLDLAQATFRRMKDLFDKASVSNQEFDESQARLRMAEAGYQGALSRRKQLDSRIALTGEGVGAAKVGLSYTRLSAPFAGVVTEKTAQAGGLAAPGMPLLTIERAGSYRLEVPVEESRVVTIRAGSPVTVTIDALGAPFQARVGEVAPAIDPASHSYIVKIELPGSAGVRSGLFGRASFRGGQIDAIAIPADAGRERGQLYTVLVADQGRAQSRLVTLGRSLDRQQREVLSGLTAGESLIYPIPPSLQDGAPIEVRP